MARAAEHFACTGEPTAANGGQDVAEQLATALLPGPREPCPPRPGRHMMEVPGCVMGERVALPQSHAQQAIRADSVSLGRSVLGNLTTLLLLALLLLVEIWLFAWMMGR
ncbi:MAG: hypothetical protein ACYS5V_10745 [Planctomycetota bacterium]|jgi:hypothetical protein